ncbi:MAG: tetratricopeptide repeat protein [Actinomycetota bacterium]
MTAAALIDDALGRAIALRRDGAIDEAEPLLRELIVAAPEDSRPWANLGQLLRDTYRLDEAIGALRRAVALAPEVGPFHGVLGDCLHRVGRLHAADASIRRALELGCDGNPAVWTLRANNSRYLGHVEECAEALARAFDLAPGDPDMHNNLGIFLTVTGCFDEALKHFERAIDTDPANGRWISNCGIARLTAGDLTNGWADYEASLYAGGARGVNPRPNLPRWTPADTDAHVLCSREQGVGDEILFASCLPDLLAATRAVVYECDPRLVPLMARSFPDADVRAQHLETINEPVAGCDRAIPIGSLPLHFRPSIAAFPASRNAYVQADPARVSAWRSQLGDGPNVAISWRSRTATAERRLEYTRLADDWEPIFAIAGVTWVSVQYDECEREMRDAERKYSVTIHRDAHINYLDDFDEVAAIVAACDLVIAPRNAVAMLAGALGVPTVAMGNRWDWSDLGTDGLPWFPTVELVTREIGNEWDDVIARAAARVACIREGQS